MTKVTLVENRGTEDAQSEVEYNFNAKDNVFTGDIMSLPYFEGKSADEVSEDLEVSITFGISQLWVAIKLGRSNVFTKYSAFLNYSVADKLNCR